MNRATGDSKIAGYLNDRLALLCSSLTALARRLFGRSFRNLAPLLNPRMLSSARLVRRPDLSAVPLRAMITPLLG